MLLKLYFYGYEWIGVIAMKPELDYYRVFFKESPCPMWILDKESMRFLEVNHAVVRQYGYNENEFREMKLPDVRVAGDIHQGMKLHTVMDEQQPGGLYDLGNSCHRRKNGESFFVHVYSQAIIMEGREVVLAYLMDDNERVWSSLENSRLLKTVLEDQKQLKHRNERLKEIAWIQSHQVRAPVVNILGLIQLLDHTNDTDQQTILAGIKKAGDRLDAIIRDIEERTRDQDQPPT